VGCRGVEPRILRAGRCADDDGMAGIGMVVVLTGAVGDRGWAAGVQVWNGLRSRWGRRRTPQLKADVDADTFTFAAFC
jgi:hypothetical protein